MRAGELLRWTCLQFTELNGSIMPSPHVLTMQKTIMNSEAMELIRELAAVLLLFALFMLILILS